MQIGLFDQEERMEKLSKLGDSLVKLNKTIDWEKFRPILADTLKKKQKEPEVVLLMTLCLCSKFLFCNESII